MIPGIVAGQMAPTPAGEGDPYWANVVFLSHFDAIPFVDEVGSVISPVGTVTLSTDIRKFGAGSAQFAGPGGAYLSVPHSAALNGFKNVNSWTIEGFFYIPSSRSGDWSSGLFSIKGSGGLPAGCHVQHASGVDYVYVYRQDEANAYYATVGGLTRDAMHYLKLVSVGSGAPILYINGNPVTLAAFDYGTRTSPPSPGFYLGVIPGIGGAMNTLRWVGNLDEWRVTEGIARTDSYSVPSAPFPSNI